MPSTSESIGHQQREDALQTTLTARTACVPHADSQEEQPDDANDAHPENGSVLCTWTYMRLELCSQSAQREVNDELPPAGL